MTLTVPSRPHSGPERLALVAVRLAPVAALALAVQEVTGLGPVCPLRRLTGVPCPSCGGTTSCLSLLHGHVGDALAANPFVPALLVGLAGVLLLVGARALGWAAPPRPWPAATQRTVVRIAAAVLLVSWTVQLRRYGWL